ncbi:MAG: [FeFe] hydrogenase H-cluster radical SAM maturase HydE [Deltaproteobacteria bacterium]|nr:[FeFe] hydrogenase H-cluster radical SAM maturase HydE [Deltaproteobacteria bacterium]MBN2674402.1 [FeFe] hydrogenase H-cluster radical SAM maturase HydE [Deltaproteobacteria bacterium]
MKQLLAQLDETPTDIELLTTLLDVRGADAEILRDAATECMHAHVGDNVYFRGLVEVTNRCHLNCYYCGIRRDRDIPRYTVQADDILAAARLCSRLGFGSLVLQSGEIRSDSYVNFICDIVARIKRETRTVQQPNGLGITLSLGVFSRTQYQRMFDAGAHRYLLRIETSDDSLFARLHPPAQSLAERFEALNTLREIGFQVGTGVMIGLPGQTTRMLAQDVFTFKRLDVDMIGMGPFLPSSDTPMGHAQILSSAQRLQLGLNMIAVTRLVCKDINIASTTALEGLHPHGRLLGLQYGANVAMPNLTPAENRVNYKLYDDKPTAQSVDGAVAAIESIGRRVAKNVFGDSKHFFNRCS